MDTIHNTFPIVFVIYCVDATQVKGQVNDEDGYFNVVYNDENDDKNLAHAVNTAEYDVAKSSGKNKMIIFKLFFLTARHCNKRSFTCTGINPVLRALQFDRLRQTIETVISDVICFKDTFPYQ